MDARDCVGEWKRGADATGINQEFKMFGEDLDELARGDTVNVSPRDILLLILRLQI